MCCFNSIWLLIQMFSLTGVKLLLIKYWNFLFEISVPGGRQLYDNRYTNNQGISNSGGNPSYGSNNINLAYPANTNSWNYGGNNKNGAYGYNMQQDQVYQAANDYNSILQQHTTSPGYYDPYGTPAVGLEYSQDPYVWVSPGTMLIKTFGVIWPSVDYIPPRSGLMFASYSHSAASTYGTGAMGTDTTDSSPALSALALLGFLYFLNLIQVSFFICTPYQHYMCCTIRSTYVWSVFLQYIFGFLLFF